MVASHIVGCEGESCESAACTNCLSAREASLVDRAVLSTGLSKQRLQCMVSVCVQENTGFPK